MEYKESNPADRIIVLFDEITEETCKEVVEKFDKIAIEDNQRNQMLSSLLAQKGYSLDPDSIPNNSVILRLSTYGGDIYSGMGLCDEIRSFSESKDLRIVCSGKIMSMGIPVLLSCPNRVAHKHTTFMIHGGSSWFVGGKFESIRQRAEEITKLENMLVDYICKNSKFPKRKLQSIIKNKQDYYFGVEEALKYKIITDVIE